MKSKRVTSLSVFLFMFSFAVAANMAIGAKMAGAVVIYPTGDPTIDAPTVQSALDLGGTVLLKATNGDGIPTAFNFGDTPISITKGVTVQGEQGTSINSSFYNSIYGQGYVFAIVDPDGPVSFNDLNVFSTAATNPGDSGYAAFEIMFFNYSQTVSFNNCNITSPNRGIWVVLGYAYSLEVLNTNMLVGTAKNVHVPAGILITPAFFPGWHAPIKNLTVSGCNIIIDGPIVDPGDIGAAIRMAGVYGEWTLPGVTNDIVISDNILESHGMGISMMNTNYANDVKIIGNNCIVKGRPSQGIFGIWISSGSPAFYAGANASPPTEISENTINIHPDSMPSLADPVYGILLGGLGSKNDFDGTLYGLPQDTSPAWPAFAAQWFGVFYNNANIISNMVYNTDYSVPIGILAAGSDNTFIDNDLGGLTALAEQVYITEVNGFDPTTCSTVFLWGFPICYADTQVTSQSTNNYFGPHKEYGLPANRFGHLGDGGVAGVVDIGTNNTFVDNDFTMSGIQGKKYSDQVCILLSETTQDDFVFESGMFPPGTGGAVNQVIDLGQNNRVAGHPTNYFADGKARGIAQRLKAILEQMATQ